MKQNGFLISVEGIDGSGKSLFSKNLTNALKQEKFDVLLTHEPGGTTLGQKLRTILHEEKKHVCDLAEFLLFAADRAQHFEQIMIPAIKAKKIIICDRMADSSLAYQGYARGIDKQMIKQVNTWATKQIVPDLTFYLKIDIKTATKRIFDRNEELTSFEKEKVDFWEKVMNGYQDIFKDRQNVVELDGTQTPEQVCKQAVDYLLKHFMTE